MGVGEGLADSELNRGSMVNASFKMNSSSAMRGFTTGDIVIDSFIVDSSRRYSIDPLLNTVKGKGGDEKVAITTGAACPWTAVSNVDWIEIKGAGSGNRSAEVKYTVEKNKSDWPRIGTITVAGFIHTVAQGPGD